MHNDWLLDRFGQCPDQTALVWRETSFAYGDLLERVRAWGKVLRERAIPRGHSIALHGSFSPGTTTLLTALIANGNVAVPLTSPSAAERERSLQVACAHWLFSFDSDDSWKAEPCGPPGDHPLLETLRNSGHSGLILLSSGSTGQIKASLHSFPRLLANYRQRRTSPYRTLAFLMLDHIGGVNTLLHILCSGGTIVTPSERTPEAICEAIQQHRVQLLPTTPTFLRMLLISEAHKKYDLGSLELITYGTESMPAATLESLRAALPKVRLKQTYGLTEVGVLPSKSENSDSLWLAVGGEGCQTKVVDGVLWIRTETAMLGYLNAPSPFDEEGWFNTGDMVEQKDGYIRFLGRKSEIVNVGGEKVFPAEVENVIQQMANIKEVTVRGAPNPITGNILTATVELFQPEDADALERRIREGCRGRLAPFKIPAMIHVASGALCGERFKKIRKAKAKGQS